MKTRRTLEYTSFTVGLCMLMACSTSHVLVGKARTPTKPEDVKLYYQAPKKFEPIAIVDADSNGSFKFSAQGKVDAALARMKKDAAKLGANGILFGAVSEKGGVVIGSGTSYGSSSTMFGVSGGGLIKSVAGNAIFVIEE